MGRQIFIGLATEGTTDIRFLESIVHRTFEDIALNEGQVDIDIYVHCLKTPKTGLSFPEYVANASKDGIAKFGIMTLAIHTDTDGDTYLERLKNTIEKAQRKLDGLNDDEYCKLLTPILPIRMIEAWMLADKQLLKDEIGTTKSDNDLGINRDPENIADPKHTIEEAIRIATEDLPKRRRSRLNISELYLSLGQSISLEALSRLNSYKKFQDAVRNTYRTLGYM